MQHNRLKLMAEIVALSNSKEWTVARWEWELIGAEVSKDSSVCLCGHYPIRELCELRNKLNGNRTIVGNVCVKQFLGIPSDRIFVAFKKVGTDEDRALNPDAIELAHRQGWINDWERMFYLNTWRKRV